VVFSSPGLTDDAMDRETELWRRLVGGVVPAVASSDQRRGDSSDPAVVAREAVARRLDDPLREHGAPICGVLWGCRSSPSRWRAPNSEELQGVVVAARRRTHVAQSPEAHSSSRR